jgi:tetratricopeptide (TPR) repeat protein
MRTGHWQFVVGIVALPLVFSSATFGQSVRSLVREGNSQYKDQKYGDAEVNYRKALEREQDLVPGNFNLGNSLYKQDKADEAIKAYENALVKAESKETKAESYYNMGNAFMKGQRYQEALKSYIESLKLKPDDQDTKYNLSYALAKLREQQQQQNKNDKNKDNKQDQQKGKQNEDQQKKDQEKQDQQKQNQQQKQDQQAQQQKPQQGQEKKMAKADAERILDVLKNSEKDVQKKLRVRQGVRVKTEKDW